MGLLENVGDHFPRAPFLHLPLAVRAERGRILMDTSMNIITERKK